MYWKLVFMWDVGTLISQELKMREEVHQRKRVSQCKNYKNIQRNIQQLQRVGDANPKINKKEIFFGC